MNGSSSETMAMPVPDPSSRALVVGPPVIATLLLFVVGANAGGDVTDPLILPLVRFLALVKLALALFTAVYLGLRYTRSRGRRLTGGIAAALMGLGAGFVWTASAFGAGFLFFMTGAALVTLLVIRELDSRGRRRRLARQDGSASS